jgi:rhamnogalacturonan endolyase
MRQLLAFGITTVGNTFVVDNGAQVTFAVDKTTGDLVSIKRSGTELTAPHSLTNRYSHVDSGFGSATVTSQVSGTSWAKVTVTSGTITHYYISRAGFNDVVMATRDTASGATGGELRFITYLNRSIFTNHNAASDINGKTAIEGSDVFASNGITASKFYSGKQFINDSFHGITGGGFGVWMMTPNRESSSGGPFFKDINEQGTSAAIEVYNYMFSGHTQTEAYRPQLNIYGLEINTGANPVPIDFSFLSGLGLTGYVAASGRGTVSGTISGNLNGQAATVGLANSTGQYWAKASGSSFSVTGVKPGTYTQTLYMGEKAVGSKSVTVSAGATATSNIASTWAPPSAQWTIGTWDGTPNGFKNASLIQTMHPSDSRMSAWTPTTFTVGSSSTSSFPLAQWKTGVNSPTKINFNLSSVTGSTYTLRIGITLAFAGGRPVITVNPGTSQAWTSPTPPISTQPDSRGITRGVYRGNNTTFAYNIPATALHTGTNTIQIDVASGSSGTTYLSPNFVFDALDFSAGTVAPQSLTAAAPPPSASPHGTNFSNVRMIQLLNPDDPVLKSLV